MVWQKPPDIEIKWPVDFICIYKTGERRFLGGSKNAFEAFVGGEACLHTWLDESERYDSTIHFSIFLVFELKFTPILNILRLSDWNG